MAYNQGSWRYVKYTSPTNMKSILICIVLASFSLASSLLKEDSDSFCKQYHQVCRRFCPKDSYDLEPIMECSSCHHHRCLCQNEDLSHKVFGECKGHCGLSIQAASDASGLATAVVDTEQRPCLKLFIKCMGKEYRSGDEAGDDDGSDEGSDDDYGDYGRDPRKFRLRICIRVLKICREHRRCP